MIDSAFGLPRTLPDGLVLRWGQAEDGDELAEFNVRIHSDDLANPETWLADWTRDLMNGRHPTTCASDFTVITDPQQGGKIVSSCNLIRQTWLYDGIPFGVGRPELVGTDEAYRQQGLVPIQFELLHAKSAAAGHLAQAITGIPFYYRRFGYEMALDLNGGRRFYWQRFAADKSDLLSRYRLREATAVDIPLLPQLYEQHNRYNVIVRQRDPAQWRYEMLVSSPNSVYTRQVRLIEDAESREAIAYIEFRQWGTSFTVREMGVLPGHSWRAVGLFLIQHLQQQAEQLNTAKEPSQQISNVYFMMGRDHLLYDALGRQLERPSSPYTWFMRVPDMPAFLRHIAPALEKRLAASVLAGHSGTLKLNFYRSNVQMTFENGRLSDIGTFVANPPHAGDARFPDHTFLQLLFCWRSLDELTAAFGDCYVSGSEAEILLNILFPKRPSNPIGLG